MVTYDGQLRVTTLQQRNVASGFLLPGAPAHVPAAALHIRTHSQTYCPPIIHKMIRAPIDVRRKRGEEASEKSAGELYGRRERESRKQTRCRCCRAGRRLDSIGCLSGCACSINNKKLRGKDCRGLDCWMYTYRRKNNNNFVFKKKVK